MPSHPAPDPDNSFTYLQHFHLLASILLESAEEARSVHYDNLDLQALGESHIAPESLEGVITCALIDLTWALPDFSELNAVLTTLQRLLAAKWQGEEEERTRHILSGHVAPEIDRRIDRI